MQGDEIRALRRLQREQGLSSNVFMTERDGPMTPKAFHALFGRRLRKMLGMLGAAPGAGRARAVSRPGSQRSVRAAQLLATVRHLRSGLCVGRARAQGESRCCSKRRWMRMQGRPNRRALAG